jgi:three-Cys-motif partner protein
VAKPESTIWPIVPHTSAKHTILRTYLDAWFPIMSWKPRVVFLDGFAGPGRYEGGEPGSPIIALESAKTHKAKLFTPHLDRYSSAASFEERKRFIAAECVADVIANLVARW